MKKLDKTISREMFLPVSILSRSLGTMIVSIKPGDLIEFRQKGKKTRFEVSLHSVFMLALLNSLTEHNKSRLQDYEIKRKAGIRARKPKKVYLNQFHPNLVKCL